MVQFKRNNTNTAYIALVDSFQGGGFLVDNKGQSYNDSLDLTMVSAEPGAKDFTVSIFNQKDSRDVVSLAFMINPSDISISQNHISSDSYTREGWLSSLWGKGQPTITGNGSTAAFYIGGKALEDVKGLTTVSRKSSLAFRNFISFLAIFKNGGYYHLKGFKNMDLFGRDPGRVISVLDLLKVSYDGVDYIGSFNSLNIEESAEMPFRFTYSFEFVVSGLLGDIVEGHLKECNGTSCNDVDDIIIGTSGSYTYDEIISLNSNTLDFGDFQDIGAEGGEVPVSGNRGSEVSSSSSQKAIPGGDLPADARKDAMKNLSFLTDTLHIKPSKRFDSAEKICEIRRRVLAFKATNNLSVIDATAKAWPTLTESGRMTTDETIAISCIESEMDKNGKVISGDSSTGAHGPMQVVTTTYQGIFGKSGYKADFLSYMEKCGFKPEQCINALSDDNILRETKFNYATALYLGRDFASKSRSIIRTATDPIARAAAVGASYNGGSGVFDDGRAYTFQQAQYAVDIAAIVGTKCPGGSL